MEENNEKFKLISRRYLAWPIGWLYAGTVSFITVWGALSGQMELIALGGGMIGTGIGFILGYYFAKKTSEE